MNMIERTWDEREHRLLVWSVEQWEAGRYGASSREAAAALDLDPDDAARSLLALADAGYIKASPRMAGRPLMVRLEGVHERARRAVGQWPSDDPYADLVKLLEERIAAAPPEQRSRLERVRDAVAGAGREVLLDILKALARGQIGL